jgi:hypothetical protein
MAPKFFEFDGDFALGAKHLQLSDECLLKVYGHA